MRSLHVDLSLQKLKAIENGHLVKEYTISSALNGVGQQQGSGQTPAGQHYIRAKIGDGALINSVFIGRRLTGEVYSTSLAEKFPDRDWILSRIMWLCGQELGHNRMGDVDSMARYIYMHGTPDSEPMGIPKSHGCIRMRNADIIAVFNWAPKGCPVLIEV